MAEAWINGDATVVNEQLLLLGELLPALGEGW